MIVSCTGSYTYFFLRSTFPNSPLPVSRQAARPPDQVRYLTSVKKEWKEKTTHARCVMPAILPASPASSLRPVFGRVAAGCGSLRGAGPGSGGLPRRPEKTQLLVQLPSKPFGVAQGRLINSI
eukprot:scaffold173878_cov15-Tisochrysis_lutea.AAC.1